jgi:hypothetical protein
VQTHLCACVMKQHNLVVQRLLKQHRGQRVHQALRPPPVLLEHHHHLCAPCNRLGFFGHNLGELSHTRALRAAGTLQGVPPSCCGRRVAVWSGVCVRTDHQGRPQVAHHDVWAGPPTGAVTATPPVPTARALFRPRGSHLFPLVVHHRLRHRLRNAAVLPRGGVPRHQRVLGAHSGQQAPLRVRIEVVEAAVGERVADSVKVGLLCLRLLQPPAHTSAPRDEWLRARIPRL